MSYVFHFITMYISCVMLYDQSKVKVNIWPFNAMARSSKQSYLSFTNLTLSSKLRCLISSWQAYSGARVRPVQQGGSQPARAERLYERLEEVDDGGGE